MTQLTDAQRTGLRKLQDHFLSLPSVLSFVERWGEDAPFFGPGSPTVKDVRTTVLPEWGARIADHNRREGD
jgi:hypothetical protein